MKSIGASMVSAAKKAIKLGKKGKLMSTLLNWAPGQVVVKLGWKAIKFLGKSIWKGIKKLAFKALSFFGKLFGIMGKFVNKIGHWAGILAHGIADKAYRFIVKPIAGIMVTVFNFVGSVLLSPIQFIKWVVTSILDRVMDLLSNIKQAVKKVLKSTWNILKRIISNPITIAILVGGLFFFLWKWLRPKLSGGIDGIKKNIITPLASIASKALNFLRKVWSVLVTVGKLLFDAIAWLTEPSKGPIAKLFKTILSYPQRA